MNLGHRARSFGAGHSGHKESKATIPPNVSTDTVLLPKFIVIKIPKTVLAPHTSVALALPLFPSVLHPHLPHNLELHEEKEKL